AAEAMVDRLRRLQLVMSELTGARDAEHVADIIVSQAADAIGATRAAVSLVDGEWLRVIRMTDAMTGAGAEVQDRWATYPVAANLPASEAFRTASVVVVRGWDELVARYPQLATEAAQDRAYICVPLLSVDGCIGVLS